MHRIKIIIIVLLGFFISNSPVRCGFGDVFQDLFDSMEGKQISDSMAIEGIQETWKLSIQKSIELLSRENAFFDDPRIRINAPDHITNHHSRHNHDLDDNLDILILKMNRVADYAVMETKPILLSIIPDIPIINPQSIIHGQDDSASIYLKYNIRVRFQDALKPIIHASMTDLDITRHYKVLTSHLDRVPEFSLETYLIDTFIDGLFLVIAREEKSIRNRPESSDSPLLPVVWNHP